MDRSRVWPNFRAEHVLHEDDDVVVVHKPAGVPSQAAHPDRPDDLVTRLRAFFVAQGARDYLGVHQRLDRDTSGAVLFTRRPEANASIAKQFESRAVKKRYLAAVTGWPRRVRETTLDDELRRGEGGAMEVVPGARGRGGARGQRAVTRVRLLDAKEDRALLELVLETGRTHQARVQLAHAGAPIAGDTLYGGAPAPRLMLHASSLQLEHPRTRRRLAVRDRDASELEAFVRSGAPGARIYDDAAALDRALALAVERRWGLGRSVDPPEGARPRAGEQGEASERATTAFRLIADEGDALPALAVDVYGDHLVAQLHLGEVWDDPARRERVLDRLAALGFDGVYLKLRPKQANVLVDTRREDVAPAQPVRGGAAPEEITILEEGVPYRVRLGDGLSTGLFLDQRQNRALVRRLAGGARVLNLFSYTCAFSVAAAVGGATRTMSVDASAAALERGRANFEAAGVPLSRAHGFAAEDAFAWLARASARADKAGKAGHAAERFDLVVLDPPSYSSTKKRRFVAESDYGDLVASALAVLAPRGKILASCNHRGLSRAKLRRMILAGARAAGRGVAQLKDLPDAPDFPPPPGREPHMKSLLLSTS